MSPWRSLTPPIAEPFLLKGRAQRDVVTVTGPQAVAYLQGQLSQNVTSMSVGDCRHSLLLQPQGHMVAWFRVVRTGDDTFVLVSDPGVGEAIVARLERFKLGTKAAITLETREVVAVRASQAESVAGYGAAVHDGQLAAVPVLWPTLAGVDIFGSDEEVPVEPLLEALRVGAGIPFLADYDDKTIPAELGVVDVSADFTKGCYTGQELVARIDSRGNNTPRQIRVLSGPGAAPAVGSSAELDGAPVASITSAIEVEGSGWLALASMKRSAFGADAVQVNGVTASVSTPRVAS